MEWFKSFFNLLPKSVRDAKGKISSSRIASYFILFFILLENLIFILIEIGNAILMWNQEKIYIIPAAHIGILGMILGHHLLLLGIVKNAKSEPNPSEIKENVNIEEEI